MTKKVLTFCFHDDQSLIERWSFSSRDQKVRVHFQGRQFALLRAANHTYFSLRKENEYGEDLISIKYFRPTTKDQWRSCICHLFERDASLPERIESRGPSGEAEAGASVKNVVLNGPNGELVASVKKRGKDLLDLVASAEMPPAYVLAIGVSAFLCAPLSQLSGL
jgi:hypothetical protein